LPTRIELPPKLGQFFPTDSSTSSFVLIPTLQLP
jgi:hypothetical protein